MTRGIVRIATVLALGTTLVSAACIHTSPPAADETRDIVHGDAFEFRFTSGQRFYGELLAVTDAMFIVLTNQRVAIAQRSIVTSLGSGWQEISTPGGVLTNDGLASLRHRSRFPFGITSTAMRDLLSASRQSSPDTLGKTRP